MKQQLEQAQVVVQKERFEMLKTTIQMITKEEIDIDEDFMFYINLDEEIEQQLFEKVTKYKLPNIKSFTIYRHFDQNSEINGCIQAMFETAFPDKCEHFGLIRNRPLRCMNKEGYAPKNSIPLADQEKHDKEPVNFVYVPVQDPYEISYTDFKNISPDNLDKYIDGLTVVSSRITQSLTLGSFVITPNVLNTLLVSFRNCNSLYFFNCQFTEDVITGFKIDDVKFSISTLGLYYPIHSTTKILDAIVCEMGKNQSMIKNLSLVKYLQEDNENCLYKDCPDRYELSTIFAKYGFHAKIRNFTDSNLNPIVYLRYWAPELPSLPSYYETESDEDTDE